MIIFAVLINSLKEFDFIYYGNIEMMILNSRDFIQ